MVSVAEESLFRAWRWILMGVPLWWVLGLNLLIYHVFAFVCLFVLIHLSSQHQRTLYVPLSAIFILGIIVVYAGSMVLHMLSHNTSRTLAALYNLSFWAMGFSLIIVISNLFSLERMRLILKAFMVLTVLSCIFAGIALMLSLRGIHYFSFETPLFKLGTLLGETVLVKNSFEVTLLHKDWFVSVATPRLNLYSPYPTAAGGILVILLAMITTWMAMNEKKNWLLFLLLTLGTLVALFMTLSRMAILSLVVSAAFMFVAEKKRSLPWAFVAIIILIGLLPLMDQLLTLFLRMREGSNASRVELYLYSIKQLKGIDWLLGLGIRPRSDFSNYPLGSHSTYVSLLFRTGLLGFLTFLAFQIHLLVKWYSMKTIVLQKRDYFPLWRCFGFIVIAMSFWMLTEDIDAPQLLAFLYFSSVGGLEGLRRAVT